MRYVRTLKFIILLAYVQLLYRMGWRKLPRINKETHQ